MSRRLLLGALASLLVACGTGDWEPCYQLEPLCPPLQAPVCVCDRWNNCDWACGVAS